MELDAAECLRLMPELKNQSLEIQKLTGGITNQLYLAKCSGGEHYVFRFHGEKTELFIDRNSEMENLLRLGSLGVTPRLIRYLPEERLTIVSFIPGRVLTNGDFLKDDLWNAIVTPIRRIHNSGVRLPLLFDPLKEIERLLNVLEGINPHYPEFDIPGTLLILHKLYDIIDVPRSQYVPCHNDLLAENFVLTGSLPNNDARVCLIDWEYGGMSPAHYDLADMFQEVLISRDLERKLLYIYGEGIDVDQHQFRTDLFKPFPDIYWFLWSLIQLNVSKIEFDYYQYGKVKYENAWKNIAFLRNYREVRI